MQRSAESEVAPPVDQEWTTQPERSNTLALGFMAWVALRLGRKAARLLLYPICLYFLAFSARARSASRQYLRRVLGREVGPADSFRHYHTFAAVILDRAFLLDNQLSRFDVELRGAELIDELAAKGPGCVLLGSHLGSFEIVRAAGKARGLRINMVMYEENARKMRTAIEAINPDVQMEIIALGRVDSILRVEAALSRGEVVGMLADRTIRGGGSVSCQFFGEPALLPTGPIRIAAMLKRPTALMFGLYRGGNRYEVDVEQFSDFDQVDGEERERLVERLLQRYADRLEHYCRLAPYNWFNFYDFWR
jgi:predicted LPLAT superfamily acyltransferase